MTSTLEPNEKPVLAAAAAPHLMDARSTTRRMMVDVLLALLPVMAASVWLFRGDAVRLVLLCVGVTVATEALACRMRNRSLALNDGSVLITSILLAMSLPPQLPTFAVCLGAFVAVALGKHAFGGLGHNLFNPAMVGRAFLMACFPAEMTQWTLPATRDAARAVDAVSAATPLAAAKFSGEFTDLGALLTGNVAGSLGETSAIAIVLGGFWLLVRRAGDWRLTLGMLAGVSIGAVAELILRGGEASFGCLSHLSSGGVLLGAFFIVTDPVTTPLSKRGRWCFGMFVGLVVMVIRMFAGYPEGVMFAVLLGNAVTPLINQWTLPLPVGGPARPREPEAEGSNA
jgi:electron transport complex protein RnfD